MGKDIREREWVEGGGERRQREIDVKDGKLFRKNSWGHQGIAH